MNGTIQNPNTLEIGTKSPKVSSNGTPSGVIVRIPAPAETARLVVLSSLGDVAFEQSQSIVGQNLVSFSYGSDFVAKAGSDIFFLQVEGLSKGVQVWERRLGRLRLHSR